MNFTKKKILIILAVGAVLSWQIIALAPDSCAQKKSLWEIQVGKEDLGKPFGETTGNPTDIRQVVVNIIKVFLSFLGLIFLILIIWAGFKWMTSGGNQDKVGEAKNQIKNAIIGFVIILLSYAITNFLAHCTLEIIKGEYWMCG